MQKNNFFNVYQWEIKGKAAFEARAPFKYIGECIRRRRDPFCESVDYSLN